MIKIINNFISLEDQIKIYNTMLFGEVPWYILPSDSDGSSGTVSKSYSDNMQQYCSFDIKEIEMLSSTYVANGEATALAEPCYFIIEPILNAIHSHFGEDKDIIVDRVKANLTLRQGEEYRNTLATPHTDSYAGIHTGESVSDNDYVAIYYVNDSQGDTVIFNETEEQELTKQLSVTPKQGRVLIFPAKYYHCNGYPIDNERRFVINFNFTVAI